MPPTSDRVSYRSVHHACGHVAAHEMRGTDAEKDRLYLELRSRPCLDCQQECAALERPWVAA